MKEPRKRRPSDRIFAYNIKECISEHERDAILAAFTAFAQRQKRKGWKNLFKKEKRPAKPFDYPVAYWMPWDLVEKSK